MLFQETTVYVVFLTIKSNVVGSPLVKTGFLNSWRAKVHPVHPITTSLHACGHASDPKKEVAQLKFENHATNI
jgi:hypothetical protein